MCNRNTRIILGKNTRAVVRLKIVTKLRLRRRGIGTFGPRLEKIEKEEVANAGYDVKDS